MDVTAARANIEDHYANPRHQGTLASFDGAYEESNPICGDRIAIQVKLDDTRTTLSEAAFEGDGCVVSQAAASMLLNDSIGALVASIEQLEPQHVLNLIGVPLSAQKTKCALLSFKVLKGALNAANS